MVGKLFLWLLSLGYGAIVLGTRTLYALRILPSWRPPRPVISVGNITVGGVGKTPLVIAVVQALLLRQLRVAIVIRGYMPKSGNGFSDEARMLQEHLPGVPVLTGANRRLSMEQCLKHHAVDVFVCDDAFQHWPLRRDLDIVAVDAVNPFGNGRLLPRGILREPLSALKRAQIIVLTKTDRAQAKTPELRTRLQDINPQALIVEARHACAGCMDVFTHKAYDPYHLKGVSVAAFCAIADPDSFRQSLQDAGFNVVNLFVFMDHHLYTKKDLAMVRKFALDHDVQIIMTTHKDAVKMQSFQEFWQGYRLYFLELELEITHGKNVFIERIVSAVRH
ncbi:MAG: tetraacyldisaccharide 4'-kinase [Candidatus Omnitrophica bacterium]|nr:tetraacyldisaccharide 4'-kinase [Candidatus Omnitrophota bacterium]